MDVDQCEAYRHNQPDVQVFAKGSFSNFSYCKMTMDNITFPTSEHAYQWHACMNHLCNDQAEKVMCAKTPREAKQIASQIKVNSVICDWENSRYGVMKKVLLAKAETNQQFRDELLGSGDTLLVESSASDLYWGSGLSYNLTVTTHPDFYPGKNSLGKLLCEIRSELRDHTHGDLERDVMDVEAAQFLLNDAKVLVPTPSISGDVIKPTSGENSKSVGAYNTTIPRSRHAISKLNVRSSSPNRQKGMKSNKFDTPMLTDFLRKQVNTGSPVRIHPGESTHSRIDSTPSVNQFADVTQDVEPDTNCRDSI